jgi:phage tail-like protein
MADDGRRETTFGDPIGNYNFTVQIDGVEAGHFMGVDGLSVEQEVIEYQDGDDHFTRKRPGRVKYGDITLKKGYVNKVALNSWIQLARIGSGQYQRKTMSIVLHSNKMANDAPAEIKRWNCFECFPKSWKISSLDGKGNDVVTEEMVVAIEWFEDAGGK